MSSLIFLALIIILVSGLIAYVGDLVGRKMGRKRLTLLGLRPRHTAIVISVGVGMLIALLTLVTLLAINKSIRDAFFSLDQVRADLKQANIELAQAHVQSADAEKQLAVQTGELQRQLAALEESRKQLHTKRGELNTANKDLHTLKDDLSQKQRSLSSAKKSLADLYKIIPESKDKRFAWQYIASKMVFSPLSMTYGQEILSGLIPGNTGDATRRAYLESFFNMAERVIRKNCPDLPRDVPALAFLAGEKTNLEIIDEKKAVDRLLKRIKRIDDAGGVVLHVTAINNVPSDGFAFIAVDNIDLMPNNMAYKAGDVVAKVEITINEQTRTADVLGSLADELLRRKLPEALRAKKMIPIARRFDPASTAKVPDAYMPAVSWNELMATVDKTKPLRGKIAVIARSHTDVAYYGPVNIDIDIEPAQ